MPITELPVSKKKRRPIRRLIRIAALLIAGVAFVAFFYEFRRAGRNLAQAIAEADRDDPDWRLNDLFAHRIAIQDSENSGLVVSEAMKGLPWNWPEDPPKPGGLHTPQSEASKVYETIPKWQANLPAPSELKAPLEESLARFDRNVRVARKLADFPNGSYEIAIPLNPLDTVFSGVGDARTVARLLYVDAIVRAHNGDADGAIESCIAQINAGRSIGNEPTLGAQLVRTSIVHSGLDSVSRVLGVSVATDSALAKLQASLENELEAPIFVQALKGERAIYEDVFFKLESNQLNIQELPEGPYTKPSKLRRFFMPWETLIYRENRAAVLAWMNRAVRIARKPIFLQREAWSEWDAGVERVRSGGFLGNPASWFALRFVSTLSRSHETLMLRDLELRTMIVLIAAERSRLRTGRWPERLDEIAKVILPNVPMDPLSGKPILLLHRDGRLYAYSVGFNKTDDHGAFGPKPFLDGPFDIGWFAFDPKLRGRESNPEKGGEKSP